MKISLRLSRLLVQHMLSQAKRLIGAILLSFMLSSALLGQPVLVKDINSTSPFVPKNLTNVNGTVFFTTYTEATGNELWKSDGTSAGTVMVKDILPGRDHSTPENLTHVNGTLFFTAVTVINETYNRGLWKSDGTSDGTVMVKDISASSFPYAAFTNVNGTLFFTANDGRSGYELWKSDGTSAGTVMVKDIYPGYSSSMGDLSGYPAPFVVLTDVNGKLFFVADNGTSGPELWKSDGTTAGTVMVKNIFPGPEGSYPYALTNVNGTLFFAANNGTHGYELWKSDGTTAGTVIIDVVPGPGGSDPRNLTNVNGMLFFSATNNTIGCELWKSDGTDAGTVMVKDILPGSECASPNNSSGYFTNVNGTLFFTATNGTSGLELWKSNGNSAGTVLVKDIVAGPESSSPGLLTNVNGTLFFVADNGTSGLELWKSDGTGVGTVLVKDVYPGGVGADPRNLTNVNGTLFFTAQNGTNGRELWKSDGSTAGTVLVRDIFSGSEDSFAERFNSRRLANVNGTFFFMATNGISGEELWKSDGTTAGTVMVKDIFPGSEGSYPYALTNVDGTLFFAASNGPSGDELWKSDGTSAGTVMVKDIYPGYRGSLSDPIEENAANATGSYSPFLPMVAVNGTLFFAANDGMSGWELWKSDGTTAGTVMVKDINPGGSAVEPYLPFYLASVNGTLFFSAFSPESGGELWQSDGTSDGTVLVKDVLPGSEGSTPFYLTDVNGTLFFVAYNGNGFGGQELWKSDGTSAGTVLVKDLSPSFDDPSPGGLTNVNGTLFFTADDGTHGHELWKSDGTTAGTVMVKDIYPGEGGGVHQNLINVNGTLFFNGNNRTNGYEFWKSDGTDAGTIMVKDIFPGQVSSVPQELTAVNGMIFFTTQRGINGQELYKSDGTEKGTVVIEDVWPDSDSPTPKDLTNVNGTLFFSAEDGVHGRELWKYTPAVGTAPSAFRINAGGEAYRDGEGKAFIADQYSSSGIRSTQVTAGIANTRDDELYRQGRVGERFTYSLPTGNGVYYVVLHFAETYWGNLAEGGEGSRRFNVDVEQLRKLTDYDIYAKAGGSLRAVQEAFRVVVKDGELNIGFSKGMADLPLISAIEVFAEDAFRINVAGSAYLSSKGWFLSDAYYGGGSVSAYAQGAVAGTEDDELYRSNRHSSLFHYNLPTGPGAFQVTLHFNETYWANQVPGGEGSRRFNVNAEGERKISGYDTYQRAGGAMHAQQEQFSVTVRDQVLSLAFLRGSADNSVDFAHVAAIEVIRQGVANARLANESKLQVTPAFGLYPNPVKHALTIQLSLPAGEIKTTSIRDALGRTLLINTHQTVDQHQLQVDVTLLKPGLYLLQVQTEQGERALKFVKQ